MATPIWNVVGASVQGTSHLEKNIPCQDANAYLLTASKELILAVADGAGSAERSQEGSQIAVKQVIASLQSLLQVLVPCTESDWQVLITQAFLEVLQSLVQRAADENVPLSSFATTLACAIVCNDWLAVGQIGDGAVVAEDMAGVLSLLVHPQRGEYANEAYFITTPNGLEHLAIYTAPTFIHSLVMTTDGLLRLAFKLPEYEPSPNFFQPLVSFAATMDEPEQAQSDLAGFLNSTRVNSRTDDDKTLVLATRAIRLQPEDPADAESQEK